MSTKEKIMKARMLWIPAVVAALFGAQVVLAQTPAPKTREQVKAECDAAKKAGKVVSGECNYEMPAPAASTKTREQVKAECDAAKKAGKIVSGECNFETPAKATSTKTREQVQKECAEAKKAGKVVTGECSGGAEPGK
jgi:hypothetical protein